MDSTKPRGEDCSSCEIADNSRRPPERHIVDFPDRDGGTGNSGWPIELSEGTALPVGLSPTLMDAVRWPSPVRGYASPQSLVEDIAKTVATYSGLSVRQSRLVAFFPPMTWVFERCSAAPRLVIVGPASRGARQLLRVLDCMCRHSLKLAVVSPANFLSLPFAVGLTVLIRQPNVNGHLKDVLDAAATPDNFCAVPHGHFVRPFAPVVLHVSQPLGELAASPEIEVSLSSDREDVPFLDQETETQIAEKFQGQLGQFRVDNLGSIRPGDFDPVELTFPLSEVARSLAACFPNDPDLRAEIVGLLRDADLHARTSRSTSEDCLLLESLLSYCHRGVAEVHVKEVAETMGIIAEGRGIPIGLSARAVGEKLRGLGFRTERLDRSGRGVILCAKVALRAHEVSIGYGAPSMSQRSPGCSICNGLTEGYSRQ